jgi:hypothetical protein
MEITINISNLSELIDLIRDLAGKINLPTGPVERAVSPAPAAVKPVAVQPAPTVQTAPAVTETPKVLKAFWCDDCKRIANEYLKPAQCKCGNTQMHEAVSMAAAQAALAKKINSTTTVPAPDPVAQTAEPAAVQTVAPQQPSLPTVSKTYTFDDLAAAATKLMRNKGEPARASLKELNSALGIASLKELPVECFGEFAMKLRAMGADI